MANIPETMEAAILVKQNQELIVDKVCLPKILEIGQVLVQVHISGICGSQLGEISGVKGPDPYLPHLMGHEGSATVLKIGPGVTNVSVGDLVVLHWRKGAGIQAKPPIYNWNGKNLNAGWITTFNTHAIVSENRCTKIPSKTDKEIAALFGCAITTGFGVIENNAAVKIGESIVVFGAGGIGLNIIQAARMVSAWPIIAVDLFQSRLDLAKTIGATHTINTMNTDPLKAIENILDNRKVDVFIDNTGSAKIIELGYKLTNHGGRLILVGVPKKYDDIKIHSLPLHFGQTINGSHGGECKPEKDIERYLNVLENRKSDLKHLISKRFKLREINDAISAMKNGETAGRVLITL